VTPKLRTLTISLVLVLVTGAANIEGKANQEQEGPQQQLHVRVYDYAQVSPEVLAEAKRAASSIFRRIGVEILWTDHFLNGSALKRTAGLGVRAAVTPIEGLGPKNVGAAGRE
jgi:hypothetical protein